LRLKLAFEQSPVAAAYDSMDIRARYEARLARETRHGYDHHNL
jgi:hypothetical protein